MIKNFLVLGIGNAQVDLLRYLQKYNNLKVHALSNTEVGKGRLMVSKFALIDISDKEKVLEYSKRNNIDFIYSIGSDVAMPTVSWVAEKLRIKTFISSEVARICNNKNLFREKLKDIFGAVPFEILGESLSVKHIQFPAIVKPVDSQGQRGITVVNSEKDLKNAYKKAITHSRKKQVIIEERIDGHEVSVHSYIVNGEIKFFLPSDRFSWSQFEGGIIHKHVIPASISETVYSNLKHLVKEVIKTLNIKDGPVYFQIKIQNNRPYLIEVTPRLDGCHMWRQIHKSTGIDLLDITIKHLMEKPFEIPSDFTIKPSTLEFLCQPPNELFKKHSIDKNACYHEFYYREGEVVRPLNEQFEKCGYQIIVTEKNG